MCSEEYTDRYFLKTIYQEQNCRHILSLALEHSYSHANISDQEFCNIFIHRNKLKTECSI